MRNIVNIVTIDSLWNNKNEEHYKFVKTYS